MITDLSYLRSMSNDDTNFIREMVDIFREQIADYTTQMPELLLKKDYDSLSKMAHKAKSSVAVMGMAREADLLNELEQKAAEEIEKESYAALIDTFISICGEAIDELDEQLKSMQNG